MLYVVENGDGDEHDDDEPNGDKGNLKSKLLTVRVTGSTLSLHP